MSGGIAKCQMGGATFYALPIDGDEINGMRPMRALTRGPRFERGSKVLVRHDEIIEWVNATPDQGEHKRDELMPGGFEG